MLKTYINNLSVEEQKQILYEELKQTNLVIRGKTREWLNERGINTKNYSRR